MKKNKLVRDNILKIIESKGQVPHSRILDNNEYINELLIKLGEEVDEVKKDRILDELADVKEVLEALVIALGFTPQELEKVQAEKRSKNGGFMKKIFLISVDD